MEALQDDVAVLGSHGDLIPALVARLSSSARPQPLFCEKGSIWRLEAEARAARYIAPPARSSGTAPSKYLLVIESVRENRFPSSLASSAL